MAFIYYVTQIQFEFGAVRLLKAECERIGITRPLVVTDPGVKAAGVLQQALDVNAGATTPLAALAALGGFEVATLTGAVLQAAAERRVIVVDGFITSAAVLVASRIAPAVLQRCVFAHRSGERGHSLMLAQMQAEPLLELGLRLGEGSGAALAWPLLQSACAVLLEMASFESAGVDGQVK